MLQLCCKKLDHLLTFKHWKSKSQIPLPCLTFFFFFQIKTETLHLMGVDSGLLDLTSSLPIRCTPQQCKLSVTVTRIAEQCGRAWSRSSCPQYSCFVFVPDICRSLQLFWLSSALKNVSGLEDSWKIPGIWKKLQQRSYFSICRLENRFIVSVLCKKMCHC